jgi:uncharacterized protein
MQKREDYLPGVPCFVDSGRTDPHAALDFYGGLLGWDYEDVSPGGDDPSYFMARLEGLRVAGIGTQPWQDWQPVWNTYVRVDDADAAVTRVTDAGGTVDMEPFAIGPAGRMAVFTDPQGAQFCVWEAGQTKGAEGVNDPGAWVFSGLHTTDQEAALAFYGAVFGWEGAPGDPMIRLPGYQDFLAQADPDLPRRLEEFGAPEGFGDVVAQLIPADDGEAPRWEVTFSVADAAAAARTALELGGQVVVEPFEAPWVRSTVLCDPDGTRFTATQFVPPEALAEGG